MALIPKVDVNDRTAAVTVINTGIAPQRGAVLRVRRPFGQRVTWLCPGAEAVELSVEAGEGDEVKVTLPELGGWQLGLLELK